MIEDLSYVDCLDLLQILDIKNISSSGGEISFSCPSDEHFHGDRKGKNSMILLWLLIYIIVSKGGNVHQGFELDPINWWTGTFILALGIDLINLNRSS